MKQMIFLGICYNSINSFFRNHDKILNIENKIQKKGILNLSFQSLDVDLNAQSDYSKLGHLNFCCNMQKRKQKNKET